MKYRRCLTLTIAVSFIGFVGFQSLAAEKQQIVRFDGIRSIKMGMSYDQVAHLIKSDMWEGGDPGEEVNCHQYRPRKFSVSGHVDYVFYNDQLVRIVVYDEKYRTDKGIGIGTDELVLSKTYPNAVVDRTSSIPTAYIYSPDKKYSFAFDVDDGKVAQYSLGIVLSDEQEKECQ